MAQTPGCTSLRHSIDINRGPAGGCGALQVLAPDPKSEANFLANNARQRCPVDRLAYSQDESG